MSLIDAPGVRTNSNNALQFIYFLYKYSIENEENNNQNKAFAGATKLVLCFR